MSGSHCVLHKGMSHIECECCGEVYALKLPQPIWVVSAIVHAFEKLHEYCESEAKDA